MSQDKDITLGLNAIYRGQAAFGQAQADLSKLDRKALATAQQTGAAIQKATSAVAGLTAGVGVATVAFGALAVGTRAVMANLSEGAALVKSADQFERLAVSIDSTADAMLGKLKQATSGMMSDAELVAAAGQIMSLGLADTEDAVVRLTAVSGKLGWDMSQVILTMANDSVMRLDALGLSVEDVNTKMKRLMSEGFAKGDAFDMAVIEAGEEKLALLGDTADTTLGRMQALQAGIENAQDAFDIGLVDGMAQGIGDVGLAAQQTANDVAILSGVVGEFFGKLIGRNLSAAADYFSTQQVLDSAEELGLIDPKYRRQLEDQSVGVLRDPSMFGGDGTVAIANARGVINNLGVQVGQITGYRDALDSNSWASWAAATKKSGAGGGTAAPIGTTARTARSFAEIDRLIEGNESWRTLGKGMNDTADAVGKIGDEAEAAGRSFGGWSSPIQDAAAALGDLEKQAGRIFAGLKGKKEFNLADELFGIASKSGQGALDLANLGIASGLFDEARANEMLNQTFLLQSAEQLAGQLSGADLWNAIQGLQGQLGSDAGLARAFFGKLDEATIEPDMSMNTDPAWIAYMNLQSQIENNPLVATVRVNYENAVDAVVRTIIEGDQPQ